MKGQFLVISSVIIGLLIISAASAITQTASLDYNNDPDSYYVHMVKQEAEKIDTSNSHQRQEFKRLTGMVQDYRSITSYWRTENCFNITIWNPQSEMTFHAPESNCPT